MAASAKSWAKIRRSSFMVANSTADVVAKAIADFKLVDETNGYLFEIPFFGTLDFLLEDCAKKKRIPKSVQVTTKVMEYSVVWVCGGNECFLGHTPLSYLGLFCRSSVDLMRC